MMTKTLRLMAVASAAALTLAACGGSGDGGSGDSGKFKIGIKYDQPGLGLKDGSTFTGMDVDVAKAVAKSLGHAESDIQWVQAPSPQREQLLKTKQVDMIVATYSITDKRKAEVSFAGPYFVAGQSLLVKSDSDIKDVNSLKGKILCSVTGSTSANKIKEKVPGVQLQEYSTYSECAAQVANGTVDALTTDDTILAGYASQAQYKGKLKLVGGTFSEEQYGIGLPKGSADCEKINQAITKMWDDKSMEKIISTNLGPAGYEYNKDLNPPKATGNC